MSNGTILRVSDRYYPVEDYSTGEGQSRDFVTRVVLVEGAIGDYAAYAGHGSPEFVARFGDKLSFKEASVHFPSGLEEDRYRK